MRLFSPVAHVYPAVLAHQYPMGHVELAGSGLTRLSPRGDKPALGREPVDPAVALAVGDVQVSGGSGDHLCGMVKWAGGPDHQAAVFLGPGVGMHSTVYP